MSFTEWEFFLAFPSQQAYVDLATPMIGTGSLRLTGSAAGPGALHGRWAQPANRGFRQGRCTSLIQPLAGLPGQDMYGVYGAASQANLTGTTGTAYAALLVVGATPETWEVRLVKVTAGFGGTLSVLGTATVAMDFGQTRAVQLQWLSDPQIGTAVSVQVGMAVDYSDLVQVALAQEPGLFLSSSQGEGPVAFLTASGDCRQDQTETEEI